MVTGGSSVSRHIFVFGGLALDDGRPLGDLWAFEAAAGGWLELSCANGSMCPPPRGDAALCALQCGELLMHGGFNGSQCLDDCWVCSVDWETRTMQWRVVHIS